MNVKVFSIYDIKAACHAQPFFLPNEGQAIRAFGDLVQDNKTQIAAHPGDYSLYLIGTFDNNSGELISEKKPKFLSAAADFIKNGSQENGNTN